MRRWLSLLFLLVVGTLAAVDEEKKDEEQPVHFQFRYPTQQGKRSGTPAASDATDHGHATLSASEFAKRRETVAELWRKQRSSGGAITPADVVALYHEAGDFKVIHSLLGDVISGSDSQAIGRIRQEIHEQVLRNLATSGEYGPRLGVNDFGSGADPAKVNAKTDVDFTPFSQDQKVTGHQLVARYQEEFRKVTGQHGKSVDPGMMDIVAHRFEACIPDWRQNISLADFEVRARTGQALLQSNPEAYFLEGAYLQQVMKRSADPGTKTFAWYEVDASGVMQKRMVNATEVPQFFYQPKVAARYAWGAAVGNWHFFNAHSDDTAAQAKYILRSIDDGVGLLLGSEKSGPFEKLPPAERQRLVKRLYGSVFTPEQVSRMAAVLETAVNMRALKDAGTLSMGTDQGRIEALKPLIEHERLAAGGIHMSDADLLKLATQGFQSGGRQLLVQNNIMTAHERLADWLAPTLKVGSRLDVIDESGGRRVYNVDAEMIQRLQYAAFFELKAGLGLMTEADVARIRETNPRFAADIEILQRVIKKQREMMNIPDHLRAEEVLPFRQKMVAEVQAEMAHVRQTIQSKGYRAGAWEAGRSAWAQGDRLEAWFHQASVNRLLSVAGGSRYVPVLERLRAQTEVANQQMLSPKWMLRLGATNSLLEVLKTYVREGEVNENVLKVAFYEGMGYLPGVGTLYSIQGGVSGVTTMTLVRLIPGYGQVLLVLQVTKNAVELGGMAIFEPLKQDQILLSYQGYLDPAEGGIITTGQRERVESPRPAVLHFIDPARSLPIDERREKMYNYLHDRVVARIQADPNTASLTEADDPRGWQQAEFSQLDQEVDAYIEHWWAGTGPFAEFDVLTVHHGQDVRNDLKLQLKRDYITGKQRSIQRQIEAQEKGYAALQDMMSGIASDDIAMDEEIKALGVDLQDSGYLHFAQALSEIDPAEPSIEILLAPAVVKETIDSMQLRAKVSASMEKFPGPWRIEWKVGEKKFDQLTSDSWEATRGAVTVTATAFDSEGKKIAEESVTLDVEKVGKDPKPEEPPTDTGPTAETDAPVLDNIATNLTDATKDAAAAATLCDDAKKANEATGQNVDSITTKLDELKASADEFKSAADALISSEQEIVTAAQRLHELGVKLAELREEAGNEALAACEASQLVIGAPDRDLKRAMAQESRGHADRTEELRLEAQKIAEEVTELKKKLTELQSKAESARSAYEKIQRGMGEIDPLVTQANESLTSARDNATQLNTLNENLKKTRDSARAVTDGAGPMTDEGKAQLDAAQGAIDTLVAKPADCPEELKQGIDKQQQALDTATQAVGTMSGDADGVWKVLQEKGIFAKLEDALAEAESTSAVVDLFLSSFEQYASDAKLCADLAASNAEKEITVTVPGVQGMSISEAETLLTGAKLVPARVAGSPSPSKELEFHVESQDPPAAAVVTSASTVTLTIYGEMAAQHEVPDFSGLSLDEAGTLASSVGLSVAPAAGDPAPKTELSFKVSGQDKPVGAPAIPGDTVTVILYGEFKPEPAPDVRGMSSEAAVAKLKDLGFDVALKYEQEAPDELNSQIVWEQAQGTDTVVTLTAYKKWTPPDSPPAEDKPAVGYILLVCDSFFPKLPDKLPKGVTTKDYAAQMTLSNTTWMPLPQKTFIVISADALTVYPREFFSVGMELATPITISMAGPAAGSFSGGFLLKVLEIFDTPEAATQRAGGDPLKLPGGFASISCKTADGLFSVSGVQDNTSYTISGGPFAAGWTTATRQANLDLFKSILSLMDCFVATAVYKSHQAPELVPLRRFRDKVLLQCDAGIRLVNHYYRLGPGWAQAVRDRPWLSSLLRPVMDRVSMALDSEEIALADLRSAVEWVDQLCSGWLQEQRTEVAFEPTKLFR